MGKESSNGLMGRSTKDNMLKIRRKVMESLNGVMDVSIWVNGEMANSMVKELS
jgi:hypothetical protein